MKGSTLKRLAVAGRAAEVDISAGPITLAPVEGGLLAWYSGTFGSCGIRAIDDGLPQPVSVSCEELSAVASMFEDGADLRATVERNALVIRTGRRRVSLRFVGTPDIEMYDGLRLAGSKVEAQVSASKFRQLVTNAALVPTANITAPILTGVRIIGRGNRLGAQASNGSSVTFEAQVAANIGNQIEAIVPASELEAALAIIGGRGDDVIRIGRDERGLVLYTEDTVTRLPLLQGEWPPFSTVKRHATPDSLTIPSSTVRSLGIAIRLYECSNNVTFAPTSDGVLVQTDETQKGVFEEHIVGSLSREYKLGMLDLELANKVCEPELQMRIGENVAVVKDDQFSLYMLTRR